MIAMYSFLLGAASAQEVPSVCVGAGCPLDTAARAALLEVGLDRVDGLAFHRDATGQAWVDIVSTDATGLDRVAPASGARTTPIRGTSSHVRTVPVALEGIDTITMPGGALASQVDFFLKIDGVDGESGDGGGGGGECEEICVCTEDGIECWTAC